MHELDPLPKERSISGSIGHNNRPCSIHGVHHASKYLCGNLLITSQKCGVENGEHLLDIHQGLKEVLDNYFDSLPTKSLEPSIKWLHATF